MRSAFFIAFFSCITLPLVPYLYRLALMYPLAVPSPAPASPATRLAPRRSSPLWLALLVIPLVVSGGSLRAIAEGNHSGSHTSPSHTDPSHTDPGNTDPSHTDPGNTGHSHAALEIPAGQPIPKVTLKVHPDPDRGWNLELQVENFSFAPERIGLSSLPSEGHAHLYINGEKIGRLYGAWHHLPSLPPGRHTLKVNLNANDHRTLMNQGEEIAASVMVEVPETPIDR